MHKLFLKKNRIPILIKPKACFKIICTCMHFHYVHIQKCIKARTFILQSKGKTKSNKLFYISGDQVSNYLDTHPEFLEHYIMDEVEVEQLERWIIRKSQRLKKKPETAATRNGRKTSLSRWKFCVHADKRQMLLDLTHSLKLKPTKDHVLWELANCICSAVNADGFR